MKCLAGLMVTIAWLLIAGDMLSADEPLDSVTGKAEPGWSEAVGLGIVEGVTAYLAVSSTGNRRLLSTSWD